MDESDSLDDLLVQLDDDDIDVVEQAIQRVTRNPDVRAVEPLVRLLENSRDKLTLHHKLAIPITIALEEIHHRSAVPPLLAELRFLREIGVPNRDVWEAVWHYLEGFVDLGVELIVAELSNPDPLYRIEVVYALGDFFEAQAEDALVATLDDPDADVQETVSEILEWTIRTPRALAAVGEWRQQRNAQRDEADEYDHADE